MSSSIQRKTILTDRSVTIEITLVAKDAVDDALIRKFGDIKIDPSGMINDPLDLAYPQFKIQAGEPVSFYTVGEIRALFVDDSLQLADLQKRAKLWGDKIQLDIQNAITALRALNDTSTGTATIVI